MLDAVIAFFTGVEPWMWIVGSAGFVCLVALVFGLRSLFPDRDEVLDRIVAAPFGRDPTMAGQLGFKTRGAFSLPGREEQPRVGAAYQIRQMLVHAGYRNERDVGLFIAAKWALALVFPVGLVLLPGLAGGIDHPAPLALLFGIGGFFAPNLWLNMKARQRQLLIERALPDAMDLLETCVVAGLGLDAALAKVADELALSAPVLAEEIKTTFLEIQAGVARTDGFRRLADRTGVEDLKSLAATLAQTELFGTSISLALRVRSEWIRTRRMQRAEERAAAVSVKMTIPLVMFILPSLIAVIMGPAIVRIIGTLFPNLDGGG